MDDRRLVLLALLTVYQLDEVNELQGKLHSHPDREKLIVQLRDLLRQREDDLHTLAAEARQAQATIAELQNELRWYGHILAGAGPITGYAPAGRAAEARWYSSTIRLLASESEPPPCLPPLTVGAEEPKMSIQQALEDVYEAGGKVWDAMTGAELAEWQMMFGGTAPDEKEPTT